MSHPQSFQSLSLSKFEVSETFIQIKIEFQVRFSLFLSLTLYHRSNMSQSSSSSSPIWLYSYIKLQFFNRIRRFLRSKRTRKRSHPSSNRFESLKTSKWVDNNIEVHDQIILMERKNILSEDHQTVGLQRAVKNLNFGSWKEKDMAAKDIQRLAKEDVKVRKLVAELGVIPVLVNMVSSEIVGRRQVAIMALIQLANGTYRLVFI